MVSFEVHQTPKIAAKILLAAAAAMPYAGFPQPTFLGGDAVQPIFDRIEEERADNGPLSAGLLEPLTALSLSYHESGDHVLAAAVIEQALQVVRVNYGLHSLDQAPLIRLAIENETARGNIAGAWDLERSLLALIRRHPDDLRIVPILHEIGDNRMDMLGRYLAGELPQQVLLGCYLGGDVGSCTSGSKRVAVRSILWDAQRKYAAAVRVMLGHQLYSSDELRDLEMELVRISYADRNYELGRQRLRALITYEAANSAPWLTRLNALMQVTDWDLLFGHNGLAFGVYEEAYEQVKRRGIAQESIEQMFSPKIPVVLPAFLPNPLATEETPQSTGFIDVAFEIGKYGTARRIDVLDTTTNATHADKDALRRLIARSTFRPRVTDDRLDASSVVMRYYLNDPGGVETRPDARTAALETIDADCRPYGIVRCGAGTDVRRVAPASIRAELDERLRAEWASEGDSR